MRLILALLGVTVAVAESGPFAPAPDEPGSTAIYFEDARITGWATGVAALARGPVDIAVPAGARASHGEPEDALGAATEEVYDVVSLGDGGSLTVAFASPIRDRPGADFAVFENGFEDGFIELAFVEVSSDGSAFYRFPAESLTPASPQVGGFSYLEPTDVHNLAGKYRAGYGTPFDLSELAGTPGLDLSAVTRVRIVDVIGAVGAAGSRDSMGRIINDPYPTNFTTGGFDLDGVAVLSPEPMTYADWVAAHFNAMSLPLSPPERDPDHDGWTNLEECAFGGDPHRSEGASPLSLSAGGGMLEVMFPRVPWQVDLTYSVELSPDLEAWTEVARGSGGAVPVATLAGIHVSGDALVRVSAPVAVWRYGRIRVLLNP